MRNIKVLVVDDSLLMRTILLDLISSEKGMEVIATAKNGLEGVQMTEKFRPDVVVMDIQMPQMDGLTALSLIMEKTPTPVIILSSMDAKDANIVLESLERGAVDFISKPVSVGIALFDSDEIRRLSTVIRNAVYANISLPKPVKVSKKPKAKKKKAPSLIQPIIAIGASTGGPVRISELLSNFPKHLPAYVLIVQHMPPGFTKMFAERLAGATGLNVVEAKEGELLTPGKVILAPGDHHMVVKKQGSRYIINLNEGPRVHNVRPAVDITMESVAQVFGPNVIGVLLTGMGSDGAKGMLAIKRKGGFTIAEDESSCVIYGMPKAAIALGCIDFKLPIQKIPTEIMDLLT